MEIVGHPIVSWIGSVALIVIAGLGLREVFEAVHGYFLEYDLLELVLRPVWYYISNMSVSAALLVSAVLVSISILSLKASRQSVQI